MRRLPVLLFLVAMTVALVATTCIEILTNLGDPDAEPLIAPLVRGDLLPLLTSGHFWSRFPSLPQLGALWQPAPAFAAIGLAALLLALRHRGWLPSAASAALAALAAIAPFWLAGAIALRDNAQPDAAGPWLATMVAGPLYASVLALAFLCAAARPGHQPAAPLPAPVS